MLFRKECYTKVNGGYKEFRYCGDWLFWIEICRQGNVIRINRKLNYFRQHDNKVSPKAEKEGAYFIEGGRILEYMISLLNLSSYQQYVVGGRTLKRLLKDAKTRVGLKQKALNAHPDYSEGEYFLFGCMNLIRYLIFHTYIVKDRIKEGVDNAFLLYLLKNTC